MRATRILPSAADAISRLGHRQRPASLPRVGVATLGAWIAASALAATPAQQHFASPEEAFTVLVAAVRADDRAAMTAALGPDADPILDSGDSVADREARERFVASYDTKHAIQTPTPERAELVTGEDQWPFPIPLVKEPAGWRFDTAAGREEILDRRIGRNERFTIQTCLAIVDAQREYYARNPEQSALLHYARRLDSSPGKRDGLYFPTEGDETKSPLGELVAQARDEGYAKGQAAEAYHGYHYRLLEAQGPNAAGGAYSYLANGEMIGGFAVVAYPASWANSGVMTFLVNQDGVVYQKDLGPGTEGLSRAIERYDPDDTWERVPSVDQEPDPDAGE